MTERDYKRKKTYGCEALKCGGKVLPIWAALGGK
jgi:hypothetical protein